MAQIVEGSLPKLNSLSKVAGSSIEVRQKVSETLVKGSNHDN